MQRPKNFVKHFLARVVVDAERGDLAVQRMELDGVYSAESNYGH
jgi:hypothetical protein